MKTSTYIILATLFAVLAGCATTGGTTGSQTLNAEIGDEGVIKQKTEFKDLPTEMQSVILYGS